MGGWDKAGQFLNRLRGSAGSGTIHDIITGSIGQGVVGSSGTSNGLLGMGRPGNGRGGQTHGSAVVDVETGHGSRECVICMCPVPIVPLNARMVTPCGHFFHPHCLLRWMEVKMDCPTCRRPLPAHEL